MIVTLHILSFRFKYILKGPDTNRIQIVVDGERVRNEPEEVADASTHRRAQGRDEVKGWRLAKETCAPYAVRRASMYTSYFQEPAVEALVVHMPRPLERVMYDSTRFVLSPFEEYLARPLVTATEIAAVAARAVSLASSQPRAATELHHLCKLLRRLDGCTYEEFHRDWQAASSARHAPKPASLLNAQGRVVDTAVLRRDVLRVDELSCLSHVSKRCCVVLHGQDPSSLRKWDGYSSVHIPARLYWPRGIRTTKLFRLKRVPYNAGASYFLRLLAKDLAARSFDGYLARARVNEIHAGGEPLFYGSERI